MYTRRFLRIKELLILSQKTRRSDRKAWEGVLAPGLGAKGVLGGGRSGNKGREV